MTNIPTDYREGEIILLTGPTASGKTAAALEWAQESGGEILSCDALLFYRGADIGTAKPTAEEQAKCPHHGIDLAEPWETYDISRYVQYACGVIADCQQRKVPLIVVGGSGFYLSAFFEPVADSWPITPDIRERVAAIYEAGGVEGLAAELRQRAGEPLPEIDWRNPRRLAPALERCLASGLTLAGVRANFGRTVSPFASFLKTLYCLQLPLEALADRIGQRTRCMLAAGLIPEVERLLHGEFPVNRTLAKAIGYREVAACLAGEMTESELEPLITRNTIRLARRQIKWFSRQTPFARFVDPALHRATNAIS